MALMFQRLAHNYIKNGYYPTDSGTITGIMQALAPTDSQGGIRVFDPCCGEGTALAELSNHLGAERVVSYGVEYDKERAWHAKSLLDNCVHSDLQDCAVGSRQYGLLFLNPPYGDMVMESDSSRREISSRQRLEKMFYRRTIPTLQYGGVLVFVVPFTSLDKELSTWIARHFERVSVFEAAVDQFKQVVLFGVRRKVDGTDNLLRDHLAAVGRKELTLDPLPTVWCDDKYVVPASNGNVKFYTVRLDKEQLGVEVGLCGGLWKRFNEVFKPGIETPRRPLRDLSPWHLALSLAAGQVSGIVKSNDGRVLLVKGDTYKDKRVRIDRVINEDEGTSVDTRTATDIFVPAIRAIDLTPGSDTFGHTLTIK